MFDNDRKRKSKTVPPRRKRSVRQVSGSVLFSCYIASAAIFIIAVSEAVRCFGEDKSGSGKLYIILAVLGLLFSVFITIMNNRNKKLLAQKDKESKNS